MPRREASYEPNERINKIYTADQEREMEKREGTNPIPTCPHSVTITKVANGYICKIDCQTFVHEGKAVSGVKKLLDYFQSFE
jgi:hypothetical protein